MHKKISILKISILCLFAVACSATAKKNATIKSSGYCDSPSCLSAATILKEVSFRGAKKEVQRLYSKDSLWQAVLKGIASGSEEWLTVAVSLKPSTDAGSSEALDLAIGEALEQNANLVLKRFGSSKSICGAPDIDDPKYDTYEKALSAVQLRIGKVQAINDVGIKFQRDSCLDSLKESVTGLQNFFGKKSDSK